MFKSYLITDMLHLMGLQSLWWQHKHIAMSLVYQRYALPLCANLLQSVSLSVCCVQFPTAPARLDALLSALSHAQGSGLLNPWAIIHPDNSVNSLAAALDPAHDEFYKQLPKFKFLDCLDYYATGD